MVADPDDIRSWHRLTDRITTSGRIEDKDLPRLAMLGVKRVINLALDDHSEALAGEAAKLAALGMEYTHIPVPFDAPHMAHHAAFVAALEAGDAPVHVHCIMNYRVSAFFFLYHLGRGMEESDARALMERHWSPETVDHPSKQPWADLIERGKKPDGFQR